MNMPEAIVLRSPDEGETERIAATVGSVLAEGEVVHLHGGLGAGKTVFVRGLAVGLGHSGREVASPTFVQLQRYDDGPRTLVHVDAYRIENARDAAGLEIEEIAEESGAIVAIEWPERLGDHAPPADLVVSIDLAEGTRRIAILDRRVPRASRRLEDALRTLHGSLVEPVTAARPGRCPICGRPLEASGKGPERSFCSDRCRNADLGRWFRGDYAISRPLDPDLDADLDESGE